MDSRTAATRNPSVQTVLNSACSVSLVMLNEKFEKEAGLEGWAPLSSIMYSFTCARMEVMIVRELK